MANVLQLDCTSNFGRVFLDLTTAPYAGAVPEAWIEFDVAFNATYITDATASGFSQMMLDVRDSSNDQFALSLLPDGLGGFTIDAYLDGATYPIVPEFAPSPAITDSQFYHFKVHLLGDATTPTIAIWKDGSLVGSFTGTGLLTDVALVGLRQDGMAAPGALQFYDNFTLGTASGMSDLLSDDFEGTLGAWNSGISDATIVADPGIAPAVPSGGTSVGDGRVFIAFDAGPLDPTPTWTRIDGGDSPFPQSFVSGYDLRSGRQTLLSQTDTGTATVYINDHESALFDPRNVSSPYFGKLDGRQISLQLYDPVRGVWESQFRGHIDEVTYDIDGSAVDANGDPINASIQINCVDIFDYLAGYGLTPGLNGVMPTPVGGEDGVWYAETVSFVDDRIIEILTDVGIDSTRYVVFSGNVRAQEVKYDPDESAMVALRDASDCEFPFIANMFVDRLGRYCWHGRYGRFDPAGVSADAGVDRWDWHDWQLGDGKAIAADSNRTQIRVLSYTQARNQIVNVAICFPQNMKPAHMPDQVYADTTSITNYGKFSAPPMSDLLVKQYIGPGSPLDANDECLLYAELLVKNQKDPRVSISAIQLKSIRPEDARAANVWACLTQSDISDIVNVKVGYPAGTGLAGDSPDDDYFIEGREMRVRPAQPGYDYVELDLNVSPFVWSADTHNVFPGRGDSSSAPELTADFVTS